MVSFECRIWGHLRDVRGHFGDTCAIFGAIFCHFGDILGTFGTTMGTLWGRFKCHIWGHFKVTHGDTGAILGTLRCHFSATFGDTLVPHLGTFGGHSNHVTSALPPGIRTRVPPAALSGRSSARSHAPLVANIADALLTSSERAARRRHQSAPGAALRWLRRRSGVAAFCRGVLPRRSVATWRASWTSSWGTRR